MRSRRRKPKRGVISDRQKLRLKKQLELMAQWHRPHEAFTCLDVGIEDGLTGKAIRERFPEAVIDGIDVYPPAIQAARGTGVYSSLHEVEALLFLAATSRSWSVGIAAEIIEHIPKEDGPRLVDLAARLCRRVIFTTPLGYMAYGDKSRNPHDLHVSGWTRDEMEALGLKTYFVDERLNLGVYWR